MQIPEQRQKGSIRSLKLQFLREMERNYTILAIRRLPMTTVSTIVDLGAHVGMFSLLARFLHPRAEIFAVEPNPDNYEMLNRNVQFLDIHTINCAIGIQGNMYFHSKQKKSTTSKYTAEINDDPVTSYTLPGFFDQYPHIGRNGLYIKVDIEAAECYFYKDSKVADLLRSCVGADFDLHMNVEKLNAYCDWLREELEDTHDIEQYGWKGSNLVSNSFTAVLLRKDVPRLRYVVKGNKVVYDG